MSTTNIRRQLGPVRKRLQDRMDEATLLIEKDERNYFSEIRSKLSAVIKYHEDVIVKLYAVTPDTNEEEETIEKEINQCTTQSMDANEILQILTDKIEEGDRRTSMTSVKQQEKLDREIEKLKIETDYKRKQMEKLEGEGKKRVEQQVKLPKIELPKFEGKITSWPSFWDLFSSLIHNNNSLSKIDKFNYLISCIKGDAQDYMKGFTLSEAQYDLAIEHLKERYDDTEFIIHHHYDILSELTRCTYTTQNLRYTINALETNLRSLESLGENMETKQLVSLIKSKLPAEFILKLEESRPAEWTVTELRKRINKLITAREKSCSTHIDQLDDDKIPTYSGEGLLNKDIKIKCIFCSKAHWSDECQMYKTVDERKTQVKGKCYNCLSSKHLSYNCPSEKPCFYCRRQKNHHSALCPERFKKVDGEQRDKKTNNFDIAEEVALNLDEEVIMKTAKVQIVNPKTGSTELCNALLDTGAKRTYITMEKATKLGLNYGPPKMVNLNTFGSNQPSCVTTNKTNFIMKQSDGSHKTINARICKTITGNVIKNKINTKRYRNLWKELKLADDPPTENRHIKIDILIGNDYYDDLMKTDKIEVEKGLYLVNSTLGWMFSGRVPDSSNDDQENMLLVEENINLEKVFWDLETIGIKMQSEEDENLDVIAHLNETITLVNNRYQVSLPWKISKFELPDNFALAEARLKSLVKTHGKEILCKYDDIIKSQCDEGIIEMADNSNEYLQKESVVAHYLPHHPVIKENNSSTNLRIVYEGCAKTHPSKKSLNECLHRGPNMVANLVGILLRFRMKEIAFVADIQKAYLQLELHPNDRDLTRFLWIRDISKPFSKDNTQEYRFCRVIWGIICSAFLLAYAIYYHLRKYNSTVSNDVMTNLYIDNLISGSSNTIEAISYYEDVKSMFDAASMNMCKWSSNSDEFMKKIKVDDRCDDKVIKTLGMIWDRKKDELSLQFIKNDELEEEVTKRSILKFISRIYDPLGLVSPVLLKPKLLLQDLWKMKVNWDDDLPREILKTWEELKIDLKLLDEVKVERVATVSDEATKHQIITFTDASKDAYAAAVYLKSYGEQSTKCELIFSKTRIAPIERKLSIPRLELMGVVIGCRASKFIANELKLNNLEQILFTDSQCVLEWCSSARQLKTFVRERVNEIKNHNIKLCYVKSEDNPADVATRGEKAEKLLINAKWWRGPEWLTLPNVEWPSNIHEVSNKTGELVEAEEKRKQILYETALLTNNKADNATPLEINEEKFSSHSKLIRVTAWCMRFISNLKRDSKTVGVLTIDELNVASKLWISSIQKKYFADLLSDIEKSKTNNVSVQLGVYKDVDGILRCAGRFGMVQAHPKLLPKDCHYTKLCIIRDHKRVLHSGISQTLAEVRKEHWVIQGRSAVRKIIRQCLICIHWEGGPFKTPNFAPYPNYVIDSCHPPFTFCGLDYLGHVIIKNHSEVKKNWICLFTCLNVRAVHLELIEDMTTESFLLCLRRFIARRGSPRLMISDNAPQFKQGSSVIEIIWKSTIRSTDVLSYISSCNIQWKFITEYAPWKGGFYERLVSLTKRSLRKSLGKLNVNVIELQTLLVEIESVINSRPLTYIDDDINSGEVLTPGKFLSLNQENGIPEVNDEDIHGKFTISNLIISWKKGQLHLNNFWKIWLNQYLETLRERRAYRLKPIKGEVSRKPIIGETVILKDDIPRGRWKLGKIENLIESDIDKIHRAAVIRLASGKTVKRPFKLIYPLEGSLEEDVNDDNLDNNDVTKDVTTNDVSRPRRSAAVNARQKEDVNDDNLDNNDITKDETTNDVSRPRRSAAVNARQKLQGMV